MGGSTALVQTCKGKDRKLLTCSWLLQQKYRAWDFQIAAGAVQLVPSIAFEL